MITKVEELSVKLFNIGRSQRDARLRKETLVFLLPNPSICRCGWGAEATKPG